jgi:hypothetical protein
MKVIRKLINLIIDILFVILLFYFIDNEFIKRNEVSINEAPRSGNNKILLFFIILTATCILFPVPAPALNNEDIIFIYNQIAKMQEIIDKNK